MNYQSLFFHGTTIMMNKIIISLCLSLFCLNALAWRESNGGNGVLSEANLIAESVIGEIWQVPALVKVYSKKAYTIEAQPNLTLNGNPVDAYTTTDHDLGTNTIIINTSTWNDLRFPQKRLLMLHELTHFMYKVDHNYEISKLVVVKLAELYELQVKFPESETPIDEAIIHNINICNRNQFLRAYRLIEEAKFVLRPINQTIKEYAEASTCSSIKDYFKE